jgi:putative endonuclease
MARMSRLGGMVAGRTMYYTYILMSIKSNKRYIGYCQNIEERIFRHNQGREKSTKSGKPWILIYKEIFATRSDAMRREKQFKSYKGGQAFKKLLSELKLEV